MFNNYRLIINPKHISCIVVGNASDGKNVYGIYHSSGYFRQLNQEEYEKLIQFLKEEKWLS